MLNKIVIFGDSISTTAIGNGGYEVGLRKALQPRTLLNFAVGESGASRGTPNCVLDVLSRHASDCTHADVVILWHGTNDWYWGRPIGELGNSQENTYLGALETAVAMIRKYAPKSIILFATPLFRHQAPDGSSVADDAWTLPNRAGLTLSEYDQAIRTAAHSLGAVLVETRESSGFCSKNMDQFLPDHVHPNQEGCAILADIFSASISKAVALSSESAAQ